MFFKHDGGPEDCPATKSTILIAVPEERRNLLEDSHYSPQK